MQTVCRSTAPAAPTTSGERRHGAPRAHGSGGRAGIALAPRSVMQHTRSIVAAIVLALGASGAACTMEGRVQARTVGRTTVVDEAPPPPRSTYVPVKPGHVWVAGQWVVTDGRWVWRDGHWMRQRPGHVWVQGHWQRSADGHVYVPGRWARERVGQTWQEGHWRRVGGRWAWRPGRWIERGVVEREVEPRGRDGERVDPPIRDQRQRY